MTSSLSVSQSFIVFSFLWFLDGFHSKNVKSFGSAGFQNLHVQRFFVPVLFLEFLLLVPNSGTVIQYTDWWWQNSEFYIYDCLNYDYIQLCKFPKLYYQAPSLRSEIFRTIFTWCRTIHFFPPETFDNLQLLHPYKCNPVDSCTKMPYYWLVSHILFNIPDTFGAAWKIWESYGVSL